MRHPWTHPTVRHGAAELCFREVGDLLPRRFARRAAASEVPLPPPFTLRFPPPNRASIDPSGVRVSIGTSQPCAIGQLWIVLRSVRVVVFLPF